MTQRQNKLLTCFIIITVIVCIIGFIGYSVYSSIQVNNTINEICESNGVYGAEIEYLNSREGFNLYKITSPSFESMSYETMIKLCNDISVRTDKCICWDLSDTENEYRVYSDTVYKNNSLVYEKDKPDTTESSTDLSSSTRRLLLKTALENKGHVVFTDGYTFEKCVASARTYLKTKYSEEFNDSDVVVSTTDVTYYFVSGYTKSGKTLTVTIIHGENGLYGIVTAKVGY